MSYTKFRILYNLWFFWIDPHPLLPHLLSCLFVIIIAEVFEISAHESGIMVDWKDEF